MIKKRTKKFFAAVIIIITAGLLYYLIIKLTGFAIPCYIRKITGLYCPGCGVTGMCISLLKMDFAGAIKHNFAIVTLLPFLLYIFGVVSYRYIRYCTKNMKKQENILIWIMIGYMIIFGVLRNLPMFSFLTPY